jgi:MoaA/NifB/PqqE/SkfB family radical SAM enzyme
MIELTNECQLACATCPRDKHDAADYDIGSMSFEDFRRIFAQVETGLETLDLTGLGESLMHPDIFEIIAWVRSRRPVHIYLTTNTILLTEHNVERIAQQPPDTLCVSIDGTTQQSFARLRGDLVLDKLRQRVRHATRRLGDRVEFIMCTVLTADNYTEAADFVRMAAELGIARLSLKPINLVANRMPGTSYALFRSEAYVQCIASARRVAEEAGIRLEVFEIGAYECRFPWDPMYVTWDGYLVPCCAKPFPKRLNFGSVLSEGFGACESSPALQSFREQLESDRPPAFCDGCHIMERTLGRVRPVIPLRAE